jgi:uncharacterized repeat protein (TIGR01451 family)
MMEGVLRMSIINRVVRTSAASVGIAALMVTPAYACTPVGAINKSVEDITTGSALVDPTSDSTALSVNSGDTLEYVITVNDNGTPESNGNDDMIDTVMTDVLPSGVELVSNPSQTTVTDNIGRIEAGKSVTESFEVKVTSTDNGAYILNRATYTGYSVNHNDEQSGCDTAIVQVNVPVPTPTPTPPAPVTPTPTPPAAPAPQALPNTGPGNVLIPAAIVSVLGYVGYMFRAKRQALRQN